MEPERLAVLGVGNLRYALSICGGLACYFGERPLEIHFWDPNPELLDLFDRFARYLFRLNKTPHHLISTDDPVEAIAGADKILIASERLEDVEIPVGASILDLRLDPTIPEPTEEELRALPHSIIRFLHGDEYAYDLLRESATSPVREWLLAS